jgi:hypothetical protein
MSVRTVVDSVRGCGKRKPGGLYMVTDPGPMVTCGKMPIPLETCPCCGGGIKFSRGYQWIDLQRLAASQPCSGPADRCAACPVSVIGRVLLLWIGESFYKTPEDWMNEAVDLGISRRIKAIPRGFEIGRDWVAAAHIHGIREWCPDCTGDNPKSERSKCGTCKKQGMIGKPAMVHLFRPSRIEYVTTGEESADQLADLESRGVTPVKVVMEEQMDADLAAFENGLA